jgi:acetyltransferase-like isoleucine patch superfamily enzyme|tara:strand:+ start:359 stop:937 length:579 start_codon:yes stop_codon:yes gene_type:complete
LILNKIYRYLIIGITDFKSKLKMLHYGSMYPRIKFEGKCQIGENCSFVCTNESSMTLTNVVFGKNVILEAKHGGNIEIKNSYVGHNSLIVSVDKIVIEKNWAIAEMVVIRDQDHSFDFSDRPIGGQGLVSKSILIGSNVWIGAKASILKGVTIGNNSVIGAHSLVNKDIEKQSIVAGIPAVLIKSKKTKKND